MNLGVVIVTYNRLELLKECISQVLSQSVFVSKIIVVNNASTDGTKDYLSSFVNDNRYVIEHSETNSGGAGGFARGVQIANTLELDYCLLIDDDAILHKDYMKLLVDYMERNITCPASAGSVVTDKNIILDHRKNVSKVGLLFKNCDIEEYSKELFMCDNISFCGLLLRADVMGKIGIPHAEYFIWHDDTEYSIRIRKYGKLAVIPKAILEHKTKLVMNERPRRYTWKDYYGIRNRIFYVKEHGNIIDRIVNAVDLFVHVVFRNKLFSLLKKGNYDWKYENEIVAKAYGDAKGRISL